MHLLTAYLKQYWTLVALALGLAAINQIFSLLDPLIFRYVIDEYSLTLKALFLLAGYIVVLLSTTYVEEGDYYEGEYYLLLLSSVLGMVMMTSARDLVSIFVALEFLSIPAYMLAAWRKRDRHSNGDASTLVDPDARPYVVGRLSGDPSPVDRVDR